MSSAGWGFPTGKKASHVISVALDAPNNVISALSGRLGMLPGVSTKTIYGKTYDVTVKRTYRQTGRNPLSYPGRMAHSHTGADADAAEYLFERARAVRVRHYGHDIYIRGLIEFTNYCKNDCYYCGIRKSNGNALRYRLSEEDILSCCAQGYQLGFRTFVLQGGEDGYFTDRRLSDIVSKNPHPLAGLRHHAVRGGTVL